MSLKKWLSYRERTILGRPLTLEEIQHFTRNYVNRWRLTSRTECGPRPLRFSDAWWWILLIAMGYGGSDAARGRVTGRTVTEASTARSGKTRSGWMRCISGQEICRRRHRK